VNTATVSMADSAGSYTLTFSKMGALGGHVKVVSTGGTTVCDQDLGANAQDAGTGPEAAAVPEAGVGQDATIGQDSDAGGPSPPSSDGGRVDHGNGNASGASSGCGCGVSSREHGFAAVGVGALALCGALRRRRRVFFVGRAVGARPNGSS
jgi:hypothetical protein